VAAVDSRARRAARRAGLVARRSRWRKYSLDNFGDFMLIDAEHNLPVAGYKFDCDAEDVIQFCENWQ
jgi:hypothetical protein